MIINIIGTSGSGKSTLARKIMAFYDRVTPLYVADGTRKRPIGYRCYRDDGRTLEVIGHYETACGGCDTIATKQFDTVYARIQAAVERDFDVLYEGLLLSAESRRRVELHEAYPGEVILVHLNTPLETCVESIMQRRADKKNVAVEDLPEPAETVLKNATSKFKGAATSARKFREAGGTVFECDRDQAETVITETLELDGVHQ